jgi:hypothetical protein
MPISRLGQALNNGTKSVSGAYRADPSNPRGGRRNRFQQTMGALSNLAPAPNQSMGIGPSPGMMPGIGYPNTTPPYFPPNQPPVVGQEDPNTWQGPVNRQPLWKRGMSAFSKLGGY